MLWSWHSVVELFSQWRQFDWPIVWDPINSLESSAVPIWVEEARREIVSRGETPMPLSVDPDGAELAHPLQSFTVEPDTAESPDPDGRIQRDASPLIRSEVTMVPSRIRPGGSMRIHLTLMPNAERKAHWNNEADPLRVWVDTPPGWRVSRRAHSVAGPDRQAVSTEIRRIDFEVEAPTNATGTVKLPVYALYFVCEDERGTCLFLRHDFDVQLEVSRGRD